MIRRVDGELSDADGGGWRSVLDAAGQEVSSVDALGRATLRHYDARGRLVREILPDPDGAGPQGAPETRSTDDAAGNLAATTDPLARTTRFEYDQLNRLEQRTEPNPFGESGFTYTAGWLASGGVTYTYRGDRLYANAGSGAEVATWTFDDLPPGQYEVYGTWQVSSQRATNAPYSISDGDIPRWTYLANQKSTLLNQSPDLVFDVMYESVTQTYRGQNFRRLDDPANPGAPVVVESGKLVVTLSNDANNKVVADAILVKRVDGDVPLVRVIDDRDPVQPVTTFTYDQEGNLLSQTDSLGRTTSWSYDGQGRVETETLPDPDGAAGPLPAPSSQRTYDALGNLRQVVDHVGRTGAVAPVT